MTILRMRASFGCLQNAELTLQPGLNILTLPNESGKSTWAQFLLAMFYGINTSERPRSGAIPTKTRYKPWSGAPMEGVVELEWNGRIIVLERTSRGRSPMGQFRAYDKESGTPVPELTAENCGATLLGAERSVFERSAFVRQLGLAVDADSALEKRLASLVTSGEETVSAADTAKRLHDRKNRLRYNKTGLIPETEAQLSAIDASLAALQQSTAQQQTLRMRQETLAAQRAELLDIQTGLDILADQEKLQQKQLAKAALMDANNRLAGAQARTAKLPDRKTLADLLDRIQQIRTMEIPPEPEPVSAAPDCPEAFRGVPEEQLMEQAARDGRDFDRLTALRHRPIIWSILAFLFFAAAAVIYGVFLKNLPCCAACAALALAGAVKFLLDRRHNRQYETNMDAAQALLRRYENHSRDEFSSFAAEYRAWLTAWRQEQDAHDRATAQRQRVLAEQARQTAALTGSAAMLRPDVRTLDGAAQAVADALAAWDGLEDAKQRAGQANAQYAAVSAALAGVEDRPLPVRDLSGYSSASVHAALTRNEQERTSVQSQLDQLRGSRSALGDPAALAAQREGLCDRLSALQAQYAAVTLAEEALQSAAAEVQSRFSPALAQETGRIFAALTNGRYDRAHIDRKLSAEAGETAASILHDSAYLSAGTQDALYLALRLAVARLLLPADTPLVLDDALVCFDDARLHTALRILQEEAATRQILLFTCQTRESAALQ